MLRVHAFKFKVAIFLKLIHKFNTSPIRFLASFLASFVEIDWLNLKSIWKLKGLTTAKTILKKNKGGELTLPIFKTYHKATVMKSVWYWHKDRHTD